jgi:hypothetical protein
MNNEIIVHLLKRSGKAIRRSIARVAAAREIACPAGAGICRCVFVDQASICLRLHRLNASVR